MTAGARRTTFALTAATTLGMLALAGSAYAATSYPTTLTAAAPSVISYGSSTTVTGHLVLAGTPFGLSGERVALYDRPVGSTTWTLVSTHTTDARGNVAFVVKPLKPEQYQLRHPKDGYTTASTSTTRTVKVAWRVVASLTSATVKPTASDTITATVSPNAKGAIVTLQLKSSSGWTNVVTKTLNASSVASISFKAPAKAGKYDYRVVKAANSTYSTGVSATKIVTVS